MTSTVTEQTKSLLRAALDNAFRAGAEAMREMVANRYDANGFPQHGDAIRVMPLPLPPITVVGSSPEARIVAAEVPAPSADVSPSEGAG